MQTELFTAFMANLDDGSIRIAQPPPSLLPARDPSNLLQDDGSIQPPPSGGWSETQPPTSEARRLLLSPPVASLPPAAKQHPALHGAVSYERWFRTSSASGAWFRRGLSVPALPRVVRETIPKKMRRMSASMIGL